jgi:hypothetical protein
LAWYLVFGFEVIFTIRTRTIDWGKVSVAALLSFVRGWVAVHPIAWLMSAP